MINKSIYIIPVLLVSMAALSGCDNGSDTGTGNLNLAITDAPVDGVSSVMVTFTHITLKRSDAEPETIELAQPRQIDLLNLAGDRSLVLLDNQPMTAGDYQWIRLTIDQAPSATYLVDSMGTHSLTIPSADNNGLKLNRAFSIEADGTTSFTIDFDLRKSVHRTGMGEYKLRPTLRIVETALAATLSGTVANSLVTPGCSPGVYLFSIEDPVDDLDGIDDAIFSVALPEQGPYDYTAGFLPPGTYTIAYTCNAADDANDADDPGVIFSNETELTLLPGEDAVFNFGP